MNLNAYFEAYQSSHFPFSVGGTFKGRTKSIEHFS
ncbi:hypothetical protein WN66_02607 [Saccharomyces cerevisiae]|nr:hypothetical protein WN66_02607 [Saccharomyces cerevisiae]